MTTGDPAARDLIDELRDRGLVHQCTNEAALREHLAGGTRRGYCGFDPTADSLTIGNLVPIMMLVHLARAGHEPVVVMGGGTGLIGDPSGKSAERLLLTPERVAANVERQRGIFERVFAAAGLAPPAIVNNHEWLGGLGYIEVLRGIGKHFSVNMMMQKDSVRARLESRDQGISYTEFSYMILQAYDFKHLFDERGVTIQLGGSDQFGNIVVGADLIRRAAGRGEDEGPAAFGLTAPLVTKADGGKFGKTEAGAVWLTAPEGGGPELKRRTSAYAYSQFWLNAADEDVGGYLRVFTLLPIKQIEALEAAHAAEPGKREAQRVLAREATALLHGREAAEQAEAAAKALFSGEVGGLPASMFADVFAGVPSSEHPAASLAGDGMDPVDAMVETGLAGSKRQAREFIAAGSVSVNGRKLGEGDRLTEGDLLHGRYLAVRRGKKNWHLARFK